MSRWHSSIATTIALTVLVAMVLGSSLQQVVTVGWSYFGLAKQQSADGPNPWLFRRLPGRVAALVDVIEATPNDSRPAILAAFQRGLVQVRLLEGPTPNLTNQIEPGVDLLRRRIEAALSAPRPLIVRHSPNAHTTPGTTAESAFSDRILIEAALADGRWLLFTTNVGLPSPVDPAAGKFSGASFVALLGLSLMLGALLSILTARRIVTPLSALAAAVEHSGVSGDALAIPMRGPREIQAILLAFNRMQDRLRRFNEDRTRMIGAISHDLRTPLTRLRIRLENVEDPREKHKLLGDVTSMGEMLDTVISFTRQDTAREPRLLINVSGLIEGVCDDAVDAGQPVTFSGPQEIEITCRPLALRRAVGNLVENAVRYGGCADVRVSLEAGLVLVTIDDKGPGIPPSEREKVFEPFYRRDPSRNPDTGGVGLGLSIARSVILEHGGDIHLASRKGGGLHVRLELPGPDPRSETQTA